jgi:hypothetical protein
VVGDKIEGKIAEVRKMARVESPDGKCYAMLCNEGFGLLLLFEDER